MKYIFATHNPGKVEQIQLIMKLYNIDMQVLSQKDIGFDREVIEDGETFEENSNIKAKVLYDFCKEKELMMHLYLLMILVYV